jgi:CRP-like cAMP-binding protein
VALMSELPASEGYLSRPRSGDVGGHGWHSSAAQTVQTDQFAGDRVVLWRQSVSSTGAIAGPMESATSKPKPAGYATRRGHADISALIRRALPNARTTSHRLLTQSARVRGVVPDDVIFSQGEPIPLTLVVEGYGAFRRTTADGRQLVLDLASRGAFFGLSSIASRTAPIDFVAVTRGVVALWSGRDVRPLAARDPGLALDVIDEMARFIVDLTGRLEGFVHQDARLRVVRVLDKYADILFGESAILSRAHLPGLVGTSREMTSRVIRQLEREGMIARVGRTQLRLLSPMDLHKAAGAIGKESS